MTTETEALRAQFERRMNLRGWSEANIRRDGLDYTSTQITEAWHAFQAGYAAAKAETAAAVAQKDAERYSWLRMNRLWLKANLPTIAAPDFDAAIDAAIDAVKGKTP